MKRGFFSAHIISMSFSRNSTLFGITSSRGTMHIFQLERASQQTAATGPINLDPKSEVVINPHDDEELDTTSNFCCSTCSGLTFLLSKVIGDWYYSESITCHASTLH